MGIRGPRGRTGAGGSAGAAGADGPSGGVGLFWPTPGVMPGSQRVYYPLGVIRTQPNRTTYAATTFGVRSLIFAPFVLPIAATVDRLAVVTTVAAAAGKRIRLGIYDSDSILRPNNPLVDSGDIAADAVAGQLISVVSLALSPGTLYWAAFFSEDSTGTYRAAQAAELWTGPLGELSNGFGAVAGSPTCIVETPGAYGALATSPKTDWGRTGPPPLIFARFSA